MTVWAYQEIVMAESGRRCPQRLEELNLWSGVRHMVLAANDMGNAEVDIVDHARQRVEIGAVGPDQHRVGQRRGIDMLTPAHEVVPGHVALLKLEAPMRLASFGFELGPLLLRQLQGGAVVDRRLPAGELALTLQLELLRRLVSRIEPTDRLQLGDGVGITVEAV